MMRLQFENRNLFSLNSQKLACARPNCPQKKAHFKVVLDPQKSGMFMSLSSLK